MHPLVLLFFGLKSEFKGILHLSGCLTRVLKQPLNATVEANILPGFSTHFFLLRTVVDLLLLKELERFP